MGQILPGDVAPHTLGSLEEGAGGKVVDPALVAEVKRSSLYAIVTLKFLQSEGFEGFDGDFRAGLDLLDGFGKFLHLCLCSGDPQFILIQAVPDPFDDVEPLVEPFEHLMSRFESKPPAVQFDAVTQDVHEAEALPERSLANAGSEVVQMKHRRSCVKIGPLRGQQASESQR